MSFGTNLGLWGCMIWVPWLMYVMLRNEAKPKKNIVVGTTLPREAQSDEQVKKLLDTYKKELLWVTVLLMLPALPGVFIKSVGSSMTAWMVWIILVCILPMLPFIRCNRALRTLKEERGWKQRGSARPAADLKAAAEELKWISPLWFLPPALISLIPLVFQRKLWFVWIVMAVLVVLFYFGYRYCFRARTEMIDNETSRTVALTRIRRYNWGKAWLIMAWATGIFNVLMWLTIDKAWLMMAVTLVYGLVLTWAALSIEFRVRKLQEKLSADSGVDFYVDEDDQWIGGMFYYNPNDSRLMVNARVGMNTTVNLAKPAGKVLMGLVVLILAAMPLLGVWMSGMERAGVELELTESSLICSHYGKDYELSLEEIDRVELLRELPDMARIIGTGMPSFRSGTWSAGELGTVTCCIDPREGPWLLVETDDGEIYLFGGSGGTAAEQIAEQLP